MLLWVTDSLSGAWSVNKGRCKEKAGLLTLAYIYARADELKILLVALGVPRDLNQMADYLSHLSSCLHRSEVSGCLRDLTASEFRPATSVSSLGDSVAKDGSFRDSSLTEKTRGRSGEQGETIRRVVFPRGNRIEPSLIPQRSRVLSKPRSSLSRFDTLGGALSECDQARKGPERPLAQPHGRKGPQAFG